MPIDLNGLEGVLMRLEGIADEERYKAGLTNAVLLVESEAVKKAPKGVLQQSMAYKIDGLTGIVYNPHFTAPYVEYGTGIFAEGGNGRKEVPWVYVEGHSNNPSSKKAYTESEAKQAVAALRAKGLEAHMTSGMKPQPYLRPALDENRDTILRLLGEKILND